MKIINVILLIFYLFDSIFGYFNEKQKFTHSASIFAPRFSQARGRSSNTAHLKARADMKPYDYKVIINVINETDDAKANPKDISSILNFTKESINLLKNKEVVNSISYIE